MQISNKTTDRQARQTSEQIIRLFAVEKQNISLHMHYIMFIERKNAYMCTYISNFIDDGVFRRMKSPVISRLPIFPLIFQIRMIGVKLAARLLVLHSAMTRF